MYFVEVLIQMSYFTIVENVPFVGGSIAAVAIIGILFGYYVSKLRSFDSIFPNLMMGDFLVTAMYFAASFSATAAIASKVMIWLYGIWILGMLLAPFDKHRTVLKKVTEYGSYGCFRNSTYCAFHPIFTRI